MDNITTYLKSSTFINSDHTSIKELAAELTKECRTDNEKAKNIFYYVRDNCHYNMYSISPEPVTYKASNILANGKGFCVQKAILLAALGRAVELPSRLVLVAIRNHKIPAEALKHVGTNLFFPHAYNQFYLQEQWISTAATFDRKICKEQNVPVVEFDGFHDAVLSPQDLEGNRYIEYVDHFGYFSDYPYDFVFKNLPRYYGDTYKSWFKENL